MSHGGIATIEAFEAATFLAGWELTYTNNMVIIKQYSSTQKWCAPPKIAIQKKQLISRLHNEKYLY